MREILFRGKRVDNGAWVEGAFCLKDCDDPFGYMVDRPSIIKYDPPFDGFWFRVDPETVGQFTGLTDKNGKKVFEGDIVKIKDFSGGCYLTCDQPTSNFAVKWYGKEGRFGIDYMKLFPYDFTKSEVIGNIHDNPELLKKGGT